MFLSKYKIKGWLKFAIFATAFVLLVGFVEKKQQNRICKDIHVSIDNGFENHFINNDDVLSLVSAGQKDLVNGKYNHEIDLRAIEQHIYTNNFVEKAHVSRSINGSLIVDIEQARPIARIINRQGDDLYISSTGRLLPVSERYTARVILLEGGPVARLTNSKIAKDENAKALLELLKFIYEDKFWKAQVAMLQFNSRFEIKMFPQVGKQTIEFGKPENWESKFKRLMVFYKEILPAKGWNAYERVNLKYQNQIICE